ncbi:class I histocompatibility antigen, F10 alpha chain-like isoform X2 [Hoplias malabaricus]
MSCPEWINTTAGQQHWKNLKSWVNRNRHFITLGFESAIQQFNKTGSLSNRNIYQAWGCCSLFPDGTYKLSLTHSFNGKDFLSFDFDRETFVAPVSQAFYYKRLRDEDKSDLNVLSKHYNNLERINIFKHAPMLSLKKVPEVKIFEKQKAGSVEVTCHATGFYPRSIQVYWLGPDLQSVDKEVSDILPNEDSTYQTRKNVIVPEKDVGKHTYSCVVLHSSIPHNITKFWGGEKDSSFAVWKIMLLLLMLMLTIGAVAVFVKCCYHRAQGAGI